MKKGIMWLCSAFVLVALTGCFGAKSTSMAGRGGEVVGVSAGDLPSQLLTAW